MAAAMPFHFKIIFIILYSSLVPKSSEMYNGDELLK